MKQFSFFMLVLTICLIIIGQDCLGQKKIGTNVFMYGNFKSDIKGKVLVWFQNSDAKMESTMLKRLRKHKLNVVSYYDYFLPGQTAPTEEEFNQFINENSFSTVIRVTTGDITQTISESNLYSAAVVGNGNMAIGTASSSVQRSVVNTNLQMNLEFWSLDNGFNKPIAVIYSQINSAFRATYNQSVSALARKCLDRIISSLEKYNKKN